MRAMSVKNKPVEVTLHVNSAINSESDESGHAVMINDELIMTHQLTYVDINLHKSKPLLCIKLFESPSGSPVQRRANRRSNWQR